ncbi:MAG: hypothetical protein GKR89_26135 [Candidatus Latescibacteria bacterium]|nr:hypothetical protein [Candidatus Latescibacterota bacterium]
MKRFLAVVTAMLLALQPSLVLGQNPVPSGLDARLYLANGTVIEGQLINRTDDLIIMSVNNQIHTFEPEQVDKLVTLSSLGSTARTVTVTEFPYVSFLGGTVAFSLLSWLQFDRASNRDEEADLNAENELPARAAKLRDKADTARLMGWSAAALAVGSLGVSLIPRKTTRRVFPEFTLDKGHPALRLTYNF